MRRAAVWAAALAMCGAFGCTSKYLRGVSKTVCEVWIYSMPQGARIYTNGQYVGRTPYKYTAINGGDSSAHFVAGDLSEIVVRKRGFDDEVEAITVANCYKKFNIENEGILDQVKTYKGNITFYMDEREHVDEREYGNVVISTVPGEADAEIFINDSLIGNGKTSLLKLPAGSYILKIRKAGYKPYARVISVLADNDLTIAASLQKAEGDTGSEEAIETEELELSPAGEEADIDDDLIPGAVGGSDEETPQERP